MTLKTETVLGPILPQNFHDVDLCITSLYFLGNADIFNTLKLELRLKRSYVARER